MEADVSTEKELFSLPIRSLSRPLVASISSLLNRHDIGNVLWGNSLLDVFGVPTMVQVSTKNFPWNITKWLPRRISVLSFLVRSFRRRSISFTRRVCSHVWTEIAVWQYHQPRILLAFKLLQLIFISIRSPQSSCSLFSSLQKRQRYGTYRDLKNILCILMAQSKTSFSQVTTACRLAEIQIMARGVIAHYYPQCAFQVHPDWQRLSFCYFFAIRALAQEHSGWQYFVTCPNMSSGLEDVL
jgi:hypothetical protein